MTIAVRSSREQGENSPRAKPGSKVRLKVPARGTLLAQPSAAEPGSVSLSPTTPQPLQHLGTRSARLDALARDAVVNAEVAPAAALGLAVWRSGAWAVEVGAGGHTGRAAADDETPFDLASVSKPFVACAFGRLLQRGALERTTQLGSLVPEALGTPSASASLEALLSHRAGLDAHLPLFAPLERGRALERHAALVTAASARTHGLAAAETFAPIYSDLGYLLAGEALTVATGLPLDELVAGEVTGPLGLGAASARHWLRRDSTFSSRVAPTEVVAFRGGALRGVVHDENAWAFAGHGLAGQAGLFGTVHDVLGFGIALLDALAGRSDRWLSGETLRFMLRERPGGTLRLGFDGRATGSSSAGESASSHTFGHLGFTGTSLWCDPAADAVSVLLTNRVSPSRGNTRIRACRPRVHEALFGRARELCAGPLAEFENRTGPK